MLMRCCSRNSRDFEVVIGAAFCPSVSHTLGYWPQKRKPTVSPLSSRAPGRKRRIEVHRCIGGQLAHVVPRKIDDKELIHHGGRQGRGLVGSVGRHGRAEEI